MLLVLMEWVQISVVVTGRHQVIRAPRCLCKIERLQATDADGDKKSFVAFLRSCEKAGCITGTK